MIFKLYIKCPIKDMLLFKFFMHVSFNYEYLCQFPDTLVSYPDLMWFMSYCILNFEYKIKKIVFIQRAMIKGYLDSHCLFRY